MGALGPVFRTYEPGRDRLVAVKAFRLDITPEQSRSLADELGRAADAGLFHPSIVEPVAAGVEGTLAYRAEEYVAAESLDIALRHYAPAAPDKVVPIVAQLAGALDFARAVGIGHGALHPRDIFVNPDEARATGFGVVDALERVGLRAPVRRPYSSPERIAGVTWSTPADVFSLAAIAYELLTGRRPSGTGGQIGPLSGFDHAEDVRKVLARAMADDPGQRYGTALAFAADLEAAARGQRSAGAQPVAAEPTGAAGPSGTAGAPVSAAAGRAAAEMPPEAEAPALTDMDDVAAERDEDEALALLLREEDAPPAAGTEAPRDRLAFDAAELSLSEPPVQERLAEEVVDDSADTPQKPGSPRRVPATARSAPPRESGEPRNLQSAPLFASGRSVLGRYDEDQAQNEALISPDPRASSERVRPVMLPVAIAAIVCLFVGYGVGYMVGSRNAAIAPAASPESAAQAAEGEDSPESARDLAAERPSQPPAQGSAAPSAAPAEAPEPAEAGPGPEEQSGPPRTRLVIRSTPGGAGVTVNGEWRGRTPLTLDDLPFGQYAVRVVQPGFEVASEELTLSAEATSRTMNVRLRRRAAAVQGRQSPKPPGAPAARDRPSARDSFTGAIYVDSRPRGARVFIDSKEVGTTPLRIPEITIGSHVVRIELPKHRTWTASVTVAAGKETRVSGSLDPLR